MLGDRKDQAQRSFVMCLAQPSGIGALGRFSRLPSDNQSEENTKPIGTFILSLTYFVSCSLWKRT